MTEPQELRSIDELFRNTFNNLPDTPAENGWDTPSEQVWQHVRNNIQPPKTGWNLQSMMLLAGFAVILAVGLYFAFSSPAKMENTQAVLPVATRTEAPAAQQVTPEAAVAVTTPAVAVDQVTVHKSKKPAAQVPNTAAAENKPVRVNSDQRETPRSTGALPLPGSHFDAKPNTTEELKAERARQLELRWKTPIKLLPVPRTNKTND